MKTEPTYKIPEHESETVEFKSSFNEDIVETLVAFANAKGGKVCIGVSDNGKISGVTLGTETIQNWINEIKNKNATTDYTRFGNY